MVVLVYNIKPQTENKTSNLLHNISQIKGPLNMMKTYLIILTIACIGFSASAQIEQNNANSNNTTKILFIGNSYLYYNSATEIFNAMVKEKFPNQKIITRLISGGGVTLAGHFQNKETLKALHSQKWDYVVLQEQSELGSGVFINNIKYYGSMQPFFESARKFHKEIQKTGAKTALLMTWSGEEAPKKQGHITYAYASIAKELNALLIPVGLVWNKERQQHRYTLYSNDGFHPSIYGSYLVASTIFSTLFKETSLGIAGKLNGHTVDQYGNKSRKKSSLSSLSKENSAALHSSVWSTVSALQKTNGLPSMLTKPNKEFQIPQLPIGSTINENELIGDWRGLSKFDFVSDGLTLEFSTLENKLHIEIQIQRDSKNFNTIVVGKNMGEKSFVVNFKDENDRVRELKFVKQGDHLKGILISTQGNYIKYDTISFSKE